MDPKLRHDIMAEYDQRTKRDGFLTAYAWLVAEKARHPDWYTTNGPGITDGKELSSYRGYDTIYDGNRLVETIEDLEPAPVADWLFDSPPLNPTGPTVAPGKWWMRWYEIADKREEALET